MERPLNDGTEDYLARIYEYCDYLENQNKTLQKRDNKLTALENGGVDNWEGYGDSLDALGDDGNFKED